MAAGYRDLFALAKGGLGNDAQARIPGAVSLTFGGTYLLRGQGPLVATLPLTIGVSGQFVGGGALVGASTLTFTPSGVLDPLGVLTGAVTMSLGVSTTISGHVGFYSMFNHWVGGGGYPNPQSLESSIPLTTTVSSVLTGNGPLASSIDMSFGVVGSQPPGFFSLFGNWLGGGNDFGVFVGSVDLAFGASWAGNAVDGFMTGAVTTSFSVTSVGNTSVSAIQGRFRAPLMHPGQNVPWNPGRFRRTKGNWKPRPSGDLISSAGMTCSIFGTFSGTDGSLSLSTPISFTVVGTLNDYGTMTSTVPMLFTPVGVLAGDGALVGDVQLGITFAGTITDPGAVDGAVDMAFGVGGVIQGAGALTGVAAMQFTVEGRFPNVWRPVRTTHGTIWTPIVTR